MADPAELLGPLTDPSVATPAAITAVVRGFNAQVQAAGPSEAAVSDYLWAAFNALFDAAGRTAPEHQGALVDFVVQLRQTTAADADGNVLKDGSGEVWRDLPTFGLVARDVLNYDVYDTEASAEKRAKWENNAAFMARLTGLASDKFDFSLYGLWSLRDAFEEHEGEGNVSRTAVRIAALWIRFAGEKLRKRSAEGETYHDNLGVSWGKYRERDWRGFNEERWEVWREGLKAAQDKLGLDEVIWAAVEVMEKL